MPNEDEEPLPLCEACHRLGPTRLVEHGVRTFTLCGGCSPPTVLVRVSERAPSE